MLPVIQVGPLVLQTPGLILILGVWLGMTAIEHYSKKTSQDANTTSTLVLLMLAAGIVGARLSYTAANSSAFAGNWRSILSLTPTMLDPVGGFAVSFIAALIYGQRKNLDFWATLDTLTPGFAILMVFSGLADLASGNGYGTVTEMPWGIILWGEKRHPAQIYAVLSALAIAGIIYWQQKHLSKSTGVFFLTWLSLSAFLRILLEAFRADTVIYAGSVRVVQIGGWIILAAALLILGQRLRSSPSAAPKDPDRSTAGGEA